VSKVVERAVAIKFDEYVETQHPVSRSAVPWQYSAEIAVIEVHDSIVYERLIPMIRATLVPLDLSSAFDTLDHDTTLNASTQSAFLESTD